MSMRERTVATGFLAEEGSSKTRNFVDPHLLLESGGYLTENGSGGVWWALGLALGGLSLLAGSVVGLRADRRINRPERNQQKLDQRTRKFKNKEPH